MNRTKVRSMMILALTVALALVLSIAVGSLVTVKRALAATYRPTELFSAGANGTVGTSEAAEGATPYVEFTFGTEEGCVYFRRDLALKWFAPNAPEEEGGETDGEGSEEGGPEAEALTPDHIAKYFSMTFAFPTFDFTRFTLRFESAEENVSKEGTSVNSLVFFYEEGALKVAVRDSYHQPEKDLKEEEDDWFTKTDKTELTAVAGGDIAIAITDENVGNGEFAVTVNGEQVGVFTNIGGYYLEYLSSASSTPRDPITFTVDKLAEGKEEQKLQMKELNGQSFKVNTENRVEDDADPVLVVNEAIYAYTLGRKWSLTYEAIDVCDSSVTITRRYAMVNAANDDGNYPKPVDSEYSALTTSTVFMPTSDTQKEEQYVSIYFDLDDGTNLSGLTSAEKAAKRVYLYWYAAEGQTATLSSATVYECPVCGYQINKKEYDELESDWVCPNPDNKDGHTDTKKEALETKEVDEFTYILVNRGDVDATSGAKSGPYYVGITANKDTQTNDVAEEATVAAQKYQEAIDEVAYETVTAEDGTTSRKLKLSAGDGSYFYLPSLRGVIASKNADYRNLRFNVYYKKQGLEVGDSAASATSLRYNALRFEIDEEGKYIFRVMATDAAGNEMKYYDKDGKLSSVTSSNIWDIEEIPEFHFEVTYTGATVEDPGSQSLGYRESTYTIGSFEIVALDGYKTEYKLYRFDKSTGVTMPSYSDFVKNAKEYFGEYAESLKEIKRYNSDVTEDDTERWNRTDNKYHWNPDSSLSFVPQEATIYVVELTVTEESRLPGRPVSAYQVIEVQNPIDPRPDTTYWLENNITSVVLFSISALLLVALIVIFVMKPSDKKIEEVDVSTLRGKKNKKNKDEK